MTAPTAEASVLGDHSITMTRATPGDLVTVIAILEEAAAWLEDRGISQWPRGAFTHRSGYFREAIGRGEVYVARLGDDIVGTCHLQWSDPVLWESEPSDAGYVHRLAVSRSWAGKGIGRSILVWAADEARARGKRYLRVDCMTGNLPLMAFYERAGFTSRGDKSGTTSQGESWSAHLYEQILRPTG